MHMRRGSKGRVKGENKIRGVRVSNLGWDFGMLQTYPT
jgi:hypothetical protein